MLCLWIWQQHENKFLQIFTKLKKHLPTSLPHASLEFRPFYSLSHKPEGWKTRKGSTTNWKNSLLYSTFHRQSKKHDITHWLKSSRFQEEISPVWKHVRCHCLGLVGLVKVIKISNPVNITQGGSGKGETGTPPHIPTWSPPCACVQKYEWIHARFEKERKRTR